MAASFQTTTFCFFADGSSSFLSPSPFSSLECFTSPSTAADEPSALSGLLAAEISASFFLATSIFSPSGGAAASSAAILTSPTTAASFFSSVASTLSPPESAVLSPLIFFSPSAADSLLAAAAAANPELLSCDSLAFLIRSFSSFLFFSSLRCPSVYITYTLSAYIAIHTKMN